MTPSETSILITGASGFIGSFLVEEALERGMQVWAAVRPTSSRRWLTDARIRFIELDLQNEEHLAAQLVRHTSVHGPWQYVVHAAGATKCRCDADFFRTNTDGTLRLARQLLATSSLAGRFVFISSLSVCGPLHEADYVPFSAADTPQPNTAYGRSKLQAEEDLAKIDGLDYIVLRPTGVYGPRERDYFLMAKSIASHVDFSVGYRRQTITFIYVRDLVQAAFLALTRGNRGDMFFLSDGGEYASTDFSHLLQRAMGTRFVLHVCAPVWVLRLVCAVSGWWAKIHKRAATLNPDKCRIMKQRSWRCDIQPARDVLGYEPHFPLSRGVEETVAWYKDNEWI